MEVDQKASEGIVERAGNLIETYRSLIAITVVEHVSHGVSLSIAGILFLALIGFCLLFGGVGMAWWIGEIMRSMKTGFFVVSGMFGLIFLVLVVFARRKIVSLVRNILIREVYDKN